MDALSTYVNIGVLGLVSFRLTFEPVGKTGKLMIVWVEMPLYTQNEKAKPGYAGFRCIWVTSFQATSVTIGKYKNAGLKNPEARMPKAFDDQYAEKHSIIKELFIATADDNYITARWCFHQDLNVDFFWLAVHCLEKYLKASLLLNDKSAKGYGHDIVKLFKMVKPLAPELLPEKLEKPNDMPANYWHAETFEDYIKRLYRDGKADNRYQIYGYSRRAEDLWKLDQVVFAIRRLCQPLGVHFLGKEYDGAPNQTRRERMLKDHPTSSNLQSKLEDTKSGKRGQELLHTLLNWNFPFAGDNYPHIETSYKWSSQEPVLIRRLYDPLKADSDFSDSDRLWKWLQNNIQLPKDLVEEIDNERKKLKALQQASKPN